MSGVCQSEIVWPRPAKVDTATRDALMRDFEMYGCFMVRHEATPAGVMARRIAPGDVCEGRNKS